MLLEGEPHELCFAGDRLEVVFKLLLGLEPDPPDIDDSIYYGTKIEIKRTAYIKVSQPLKGFRSYSGSSVTEIF